MRIEIYMACPLCVAEGHSIAKEYWRHGSDGGLTSWMFKPCNGILCLDEKANVICSKCGKSTPLLKVHLSCNGGRHKFAVASNVSYAQTISTASNCVSKGGLSYLQSILKHIG